MRDELNVQMNWIRSDLHPPPSGTQCYFVELRGKIPRIRSCMFDYDDEMRLGHARLTVCPDDGVPFEPDKFVWWTPLAWFKIFQEER